jgi:hypothetical protein
MIWRQRVGWLVETADRVSGEHMRAGAPTTSPATDHAVVLNGGLSRPLALVGDALVRSLMTPAYAEASRETLETWVAVWRDVAAEFPDLALATRLFGVGVRYLWTRDERVLLDLLQEERAVLRDLFGLPDKS